MVGMVVLMLAVSMIGCSQFALEGLRHERAVPANGAAEQSESNLPAIKALLAGERQQFRAVFTPINRADSPVATPVVAPDDVTSSSSSPIVRVEDLTSAHLLRMFLVAPDLSAKASQYAPHVRPLVPTTRSSADAPSQDRPAVPPYTFFAPTGSAYPGSIRCVPDYLGGQRCRNSP